jgi:hypothetical protein
VSFAAITPCVASQRVIPKVSIYFVIDSVRELLDTPSYVREVQRNAAKIVRISMMYIYHVLVIN